MLSKLQRTLRTKYLRLIYWFCFIRSTMPMILIKQTDFVCVLRVSLWLEVGRREEDLEVSAALWWCDKEFFFSRNPA